MLTTDRNHPELTQGVDTTEVPQAKVYLVLSDEEKAKGYVRTVRKVYIHRGIKVSLEQKDNITVLSKEDQHKYNQYGYYAYIKYSEDKYPSLGEYITKEVYNAIQEGKQYVNGCGTTTRMVQEIAETYARNPKFYGATYCISCKKHLPVSEFVWLDNPDQEVGS